jgi:signal peptidase complex subunit 1
MFPSMDLVGQKRAEFLAQVIIVIAAAVSAIFGYLVQDFHAMLYSFVAGVALALLVALPPWPAFARNPLRWRASTHAEN